MKTSIEACAGRIRAPIYRQFRNTPAANPRMKYAPLDSTSKVFILRQLGEVLEVEVREAKQEQKRIFRAAYAFFCLIRAHFERLEADAIRILPEKSLLIIPHGRAKENDGDNKQLPESPRRAEARVWP